MSIIPVATTPVSRTSALSRRAVLTRVAALAATAGLAGCAGSLEMAAVQSPPPPATSATAGAECRSELRSPQCRHVRAGR
jgi:hypothetical protein